MNKRNAETEPIETEPKPRGLIVFRGYFHDDLNLEGVSSLISDVEDYLKLPYDRKIIFEESATLTPERSSLIREYTNQHGFLRIFTKAYLKSQLKREPSEEEVEGKTSQFKTLTQEEGYRILPGFLQFFYLCKAYDELRGGYNLEASFEQHFEDVTRKSEEAEDKFSQKSKDASNAWKERRFGDFLNLYRESRVYLRETMQIRDADTASLISQAISSFPEGQSYLIIIPFGHLHKGLIHLISSQLGNKETAYQTRSGVLSRNMQEMINFVALGEHISDEDLARVAMEEKIYAIIPSLIKNLNDLGWFTLNYEKIHLFIGEIIDRLSIEEIEKICSRKVKIPDLAKDILKKAKKEIEYARTS